MQELGDPTHALLSRQLSPTEYRFKGKIVRNFMAVTSEHRTTGSHPVSTGLCVTVLAPHHGPVQEEVLLATHTSVLAVSWRAQA